MAEVTMDRIMSASFGETASSIRSTFKRTINIRQYETETLELSSTLDIGRSLCGIERMVISAILQAQLEYEAYIQMSMKGYITSSEFDMRKKVLTEDVAGLVAKGEALLGKALDYLFDLANTAEVKSEN